MEVARVWFTRRRMSSSLVALASYQPGVIRDFNLRVPTDVLSVVETS